MGYAIARIKDGANCSQDFAYYNWPPSNYKDGRKLAGVEDDAVFVVEKTSYNRANWECVAPGAGEIGTGRYGNGSIYADGVDMLTPILGFKPDLEYWVKSGKYRPVIERDGE